MKTAYFDCHSGISGDMTLGALLDLGFPLERLNTALDSLGMDGLAVQVRDVVKKGFRAKHITVEHPHEHVHRHLSHIRDIIERGFQSGGFPERARDTALAIFTKIAEAEAQVHGCDIEEVHFHEVGAWDSIADIVGCAVGFDELGIENFLAGTVATGTGTVRIAHGACPVPAPATALLLRGIPVVATDIPCELTTPTGAGILATLVSRFGPLPEMRLEAVGCGAGTRDLPEQANILRILVGETEPESTEFSASFGAADIWVVETNLDDMPGELIGHVLQRLWTLPVPPLDVWTTPIQMKKQRPGVTLSVLCQKTGRDAVETLLLEETTALGVRRYPVERTVLERMDATVATPWGELRVKRAVLPDGTFRTTPEYDAAREMALAANVQLWKVYDAVRNS